MKFLLKNMAFLIILAFALSGFSACTKTPPAANGGDNSAPVNTNAANTNAGTSEKKTGEYPPLPAAIAQEQIKLTDNTTITLNDKKGKVILINLWATWCGPCRGEMPHLVEMQNAFRDKNFEIIGLDVDPETVEEINDFAKEMKLNYTLGWTGETLSSEFVRLSKFEGIPQSFLIDREGRLRGVFVGGSKKVVTSMKENVEKLVNE